ncbi:MAG TPA: hypothetical protein VL984_17570 [Acidimicrobiales bacterium]|nr:hypothetical protein [Acidimicrobiales bacterium]
MASGLTTTTQVDEAASKYIADTYPTLRCGELSTLKLDETWLVQANLSGGGPDAPERLVLLVNRFGWVEEVGGQSTRQNAQRVLVAMEAKALAAS